MRRVLRGADATVTLPLLDADGEPGEPASPPGVTVTDLAGAAVTGSPFTATLDDENRASFTLPGTVTGTLDQYTLTATADTAGGVSLVGRDSLLVVDRFLYSVATYRERVTKHADETHYPLPSMLALRQAVEERIERAARRAFTRRAKLATVRVDRRGRVPLPDIDIDTIRAVTVDGTTVDVADVELSGIDSGWLRLASGGSWTAGDLATVIYEYGMVTAPAPIVDAAIELASASEVAPAIPRRATAMTSELGAWRITVAGRDGPTGLPDVDVAIEEWGNTDPVFA